MTIALLIGAGLLIWLFVSTMNSLKLARTKTDDLKIGDIFCSTTIPRDPWDTYRTTYVEIVDVQGDWVKYSLLKADRSRYESDVIGDTVNKMPIAKFFVFYDKYTGE